MFQDRLCWHKASSVVYTTGFDVLLRVVGKWGHLGSTEHGEPALEFSIMSLSPGPKDTQDRGEDPRDHLGVGLERGVKP